MTSLRLAVVCRRYWPAIDEPQQAISRLADGLRQAGHRVTIFTAALGSKWPAQVVHREIPVERLTQLHYKPWGTVTYLWSLVTHLRTHLDQFDAVIVSGLRYDAYAVVRALRGSKIPVLLWSEGAGIGGDVEWRQTANFGPRVLRGCFEADAILCTSTAAADELRSAGASDAITHTIPLGIAPFPGRVSVARQHARICLAACNHDLQLDHRAPLAIYHGPLAAGLGLTQLITAWRAIQLKLPQARLWIIGDGSERETLWQMISDFDLRYRVCMPGVFDDLAELLAAADLLVMPHLVSTSHSTMAAAVAAGLPVVAGDVPTSSELITHEREGLLVNAARPADLSEAIAEVLGDPVRAARHSQAARETASRQLSIQRMIDATVEQVERSIQQRHST